MRKSLPIFISFVAISCVTTSVTKLNPNKTYPVTTPNNVVVYLSPEDIQCDYEKVALIKTKSGYALDDEKSVKATRKKAAELGANGVLLNKIEDPSTAEKVANALFWTGASKDGELLAIYVRESGCLNEETI